MRFMFLWVVCLCFVNPFTHANASFPIKEEKFVENKDVRLFCRVFGAGDPIVVIHGGPGLMQDYLLPYLSQLAENNLVIFYDQRCCGLSSGDVTPATLQPELFLEDLEAIRVAFRLQKMTLLGHSMGASLAMQYAIAHPEYIKKLILSNTGPASSQEFFVFAKEWFVRTLPYQADLRAIQASPSFRMQDPLAIEHYYRTLFQPYCYDAKNVNALNVKIGGKAAINSFKMVEMFRQQFLFKTFDLHPQLKMLNIPTLVIHGDADIIPPLMAQRVHESIHGSDYVLIRQCGHFPFVEAPEEFFASIKNFLNK